MAQETSATILTRARIKAQDNDASGNYATALILLNDLVGRFNNSVKTKTKTIAAVTSGLSFSANTVSKVTTADINAIEFESFHQSNSSALSYPLSPAIERVSVIEMLSLLNFDGNTALRGSATEWTQVAAEKTQDDTAASGVEVWRVYGFPVISTTRYMHVKAIVPTAFASIGAVYADYGDAVDGLVLSDLLAYELAKLKKETSQGFLDNILRSIPQGILDIAYGGAIRAQQLQDGIIKVEY
jgi:hypothetical protein